MIDKKSYFERRVNLLTQIEQLKADIKQLQEDTVYDSDTNPSGLDKTTIKAVNKAAALEVAQKYEEFREDVSAVMSEFEELTDYNV
jgi:hypothetical protein